MFWLRNKKINFLVHTLNLRPALDLTFKAEYKFFHSDVFCYFLDSFSFEK